MLLLHRHLAHEHVVAGLRAGALTADAVALEARKSADTAHDPEPVPAPGAAVTPLTLRRLAQLPPDTRPLPSVAVYDQLLPSHRRREGTR